MPPPACRSVGTRSCSWRSSGDNPFEPETHVIGDPRNPRTGSYYIRPFGRPVIEGFFGGEGAEVLAEHGPAAGFAYAIDELAALFGSDVRRSLRPLAVSNWSRMDSIGGGYSYALPGKAEARDTLARPFDGRLFFAGEATAPPRLLNRPRGLSERGAGGR